jgi:REP element-mobilizing transposase RayT
LKGDPGQLKFITSSSYRRLKLFSSPRFRWVFVELLRQLRQETGSLLIGWVLMPEHFHLLIKPGPAESTTIFMQELKKRTAQRIIAALIENAPYPGSTATHGCVFFCLDFLLHGHSWLCHWDHWGPATAADAARGSFLKPHSLCSGQALWLFHFLLACPFIRTKQEKSAGPKAGLSYEYSPRGEDRPAGAEQSSAIHVPPWPADNPLDAPSMDATSSPAKCSLSPAALAGA